MSFKSLVVAETANRRVLPRTKGMPVARAVRGE
jgi:hypothetical protein